MSMDLDAPTAGQAVSVHRLPHEVQTGGSQLNEWSALRDRSTTVHGFVADGHHEARKLELNKRTLAIALRDPVELLDDLAVTRGLSWTTIARLAGVSSTAVRKWRKGSPITGENLRHLAGVIAFLDLVADAFSPLQDASSWLEVPLSDDATLTATEIYARGGVNLLLDWASGRLDPNEMLDRFDPQWRTHYARDSRFALEYDADGLPTLVDTGLGG